MALIDDINALPTTVGDGNTGHLNNHQVIHTALKDHAGRLASHTHTSASITDAVSSLGSGSAANRIVRADANGKIFIATASITSAGDPINKTFLDGRIPESLPLTTNTTSGTRVMAGTHMIFGDTGWRNITSNLVNGWTAEIVRIRRQGNTVTLEHRGLRTPEVENLAWITLPAGFADQRTMIPITTRAGIFTSTVSNSLGCSFHAMSGFTLDTYAMVASTWSVSAAWPSTLPGTPA